MIQPLTLKQIREIEAIKRTLATQNITIEISDSNREMWLNILTIVLQANEANTTNWRKSYSPQKT